MKKTKKKGFTLDDYIKAAKKGSREAEQELLGPGFHAVHRVHRSKKTYTRKPKHKRGEEGV
ncbi:hypothetical protein [Bacteroidaceae bacterium]|jgi:hypothetical protein|nr:hypothetical protein [Bacteroides sp.]